MTSHSNDPSFSPVLGELTEFVTAHRDCTIEINISTWSECAMSLALTDDEAEVTRMIARGEIIKVSDDPAAPPMRALRPRSEYLREQIAALSESLPFQEGQGYYQQRQQIQEMQRELKQIGE